MTGKRFTLTEVLSRPLLEALVLDLGKNIPEIMDMFDCSERTIRRELRKHGLLAKATRRPRRMMVSDAERIAKVIRKPELPKLEILPYKKEESQEAIHIMVSDIQIGQKLPCEDSSRAKLYYEEAFDYFNQNILKVLSNLRHGYNQVNIHLIGDLVEGENIYHNQAYDSFHLRDQLDIGYKGLCELIETVKEIGTEYPIEIYSTRGNHGRTGWKTSNESNWDTVLSKMIEARYQDDEFINTSVSHKKDHVSTDVFGWRYLQTHGDNIPMNYSMPYYGMDRMIGGWANIYEKVDAVLIGHFHISSRIRPAGIPAFLNGCWRISDYPIERMARVPTRCQWIFGSSAERPVTWSYEVDTEPPKYKDDLKSFLLESL